MSLAARGELLELASSVLRRGSDALPLEKRLRAALRAHPGLGGEERAFLAEVVLGTACHALRLQYQLERAGLPVTPPYLLALYLLDEHGTPPAEAVAQVGTAALSSTPFPDDAVAHLSARYSLPVTLAKRLVAQWGLEEATAFGAAVNQRGPVTLRVNTLKTSRTTLLARLAEAGVAARPGQWSPWSVLLDERWNLRSSAAWRTGEFEVQDEGSQVIALETRVKPGDVVLDLCAGRGGKSLALAAQLENQGRVIAFDIDERRLRDLAVRRQRAGATCIEIVSDKARLPAEVDLVLVDAPCGESGVLRRSPGRRLPGEGDDFSPLTTVQLQLLEEGAARVRPGGALIYATCSVLAEENEDVLASFLRAWPDFGEEGRRTLLPHREGTDGFFVARLRRSQGEGIRLSPEGSVVGNGSAA